MVNALFTKDNKEVAYLYGYPTTIGYDIKFTKDRYSSVEFNEMKYQSEITIIKNDSNDEESYVSYTLD